MTSYFESDITIIGGGIAGLWLLNSLRNLGYNVILLEKDRLGTDQTIASQGMIHGGIKYTLSGSLSGSSEAIAGMPDVWRSCIAGNNDVDLRDVKVLSEHYYMCSVDTVASKLTAFFGSKALRGRVTRLPRENYPAAFNSDSFKGSLYQLGDLVLDVPSLLGCLLEKHQNRVFKLDTEQQQSLEMESDARIKHIRVNSDLCITAKRYIFAAGAGNAGLLEQAGLDAPAMQLRPLHQVLVKHQYKHPIYAHCVDMKSGAKPRLTITTHPSLDDQQIWNLGGELAESGVSRDKQQQISFARKELANILPWINLDQASWETINIDRAEPMHPDGLRAEDPFAKASGNLMVTWPIKLSLAPALADSVSSLLSGQGIRPTFNKNPVLLERYLSTPEVAIPVWQNLFDTQGR